MEPLRIALCDDEQAMRELLEKYIGEWAVLRNHPAAVSSFCSGGELLRALDGKPFDLVVLDIQMQEPDGMRVARTIRETDCQTGILFVTGYEDYLAEGYEVEAFRYLLKPLKKEKLQEALDSFLVRRRKQPRFWTLKTPYGQKRVSLSEILYVESFGHTCRLYTLEESFPVKAGITEMEQQMQALGLAMFRTHRSYLVNLAQVTAVGREQVSLCGEVNAPVSRTRYQALNQAFIRYFRRDAQI